MTKDKDFDTLGPLSQPALDNELLRTFVAVVECGGYTLAGKVLHKTQSAISLQIKRLEDALNVPLFEHPRRQVVLTSQGEAFLPHARRLIQCNADALAAMDGERRGGRVRLGSNNYHATDVLPELLATFCAAHPEIQIELQTGAQKMLSDGLGASFDIILNFYALGEHRGDIVSRQRLVWVRSRRHETHLQRPLPIALLPEGTLMRRLAMESLGRAGLPWRLAYQSPNVAATMASVSAGLAVSVCVHSRLDHNPGLVELGEEEGFEPLPTCVFTLECADRYLSRGTVLLRDFLLERLGTTGPGDVDP